MRMRSAELHECDDVSLLGRARAGDLDAFGELICRHERAALRLATVVAGASEAGDIVQEAFVNIQRQLGSYRGTGSVRSWMLRVVANEAKNHLRSQFRRRRRDDRHARRSPQTTSGVDDAVIERLEHEQLAFALAALSERDRAVLGCRYVTGLTEAETAEVLGTAVGTVKSRTSRALDRLEEQLGRLDGTGDTR
jgi:RNA polymerase sigma factor (sigma-70 family)